jgi:hypothetical protein
MQSGDFCCSAAAQGSGLFAPGQSVLDSAQETVVNQFGELLTHGSLKSHTLWLLLRTCGRQDVVLPDLART